MSFGSPFPGPSPLCLSNRIIGKGIRNWRVDDLSHLSHMMWGLVVAGILKGSDFGSLEARPTSPAILWLFKPLAFDPLPLFPFPSITSPAPLLDYLNFYHSLDVRISSFQCL